MLSVGRFRRRCQRSFLRSSHRSTNIAFSVSNNATRPKRTRAYEAADRYRFDRFSAALDLARKGRRGESRLARERPSGLYLASS